MVSIDRNCALPLHVHVASFEQNYKNSVNRIQCIRRQTIALNCMSPVYKWTRKQRCDGLLASPECTKSKFVRTMILASRRLEDIGDVLADNSGFITKRLLQLSKCYVKECDHKAYFADLAASMVARSIALLIRFGSLNTLKALGGVAFGASMLCSLIAITANGGGLRQWQANLIKSDTPYNNHYRSTAKIVGRFCRKQLGSKLNNKKIAPTMNKTYEVKAKPSVKLISPSELVNNPKYNHTHGAWLLKASVATFKFLNKMVVSWDKHIGYQLGKRTSPFLGRLISTQLMLSACAFIAAYSGFFFLPIKIPLAVIGVSACLIAISVGYAGWKIANRELILKAKAHSRNEKKARSLQQNFNELPNKWQFKLRTKNLQEVA